MSAEFFNTIYKFHPHTRQNAEDMTGEPDDAKLVCAALLRQGDRIYWHSDTGEKFHRVGLANIRFVMEMSGYELTVIEDIQQ